MNKIISFFFLFLQIWSGFGIASDMPRKPNIIIIFTDDQGYADVGCYDERNNHQVAQTPHIDSLATEGVRLTDGYVTAPVCGPSRAGIMTGRYQQRFNFYGNKAVFDDGFTAQKTLGSQMQELGYHTGVIGKWHLGRRTQDRWPNERGFDEFYGFLKSMRGYFGQNSSNPIYRNKEIIPAEEGYLTDSFNKEAVSFINRNAEASKNGKPFFLYASYNAPHYPVEAKEDDIKKYNSGRPERNTFLAMIGSVDDGVGMMKEALVKNGIYRDTLIFFLSDNGGEPGRGACNEPLRGGKLSYYEGGIRVPFIVSWPNGLPAGKVNNTPVMSFDIFSTCVAVAQGDLGKVTKELDLDGRNMLPVLTEESQEPLHENLFWQSGGRQRQNWGMRQGKYKLVYMKEAASLYDLETDIGETKDLSASMPEKVQSMLSAYKKWDELNRIGSKPFVLENSRWSSKD